MSADEADAYLSEGMTETLRATLGNISALRVPGRSTSVRYKHSSKSISEIAQELSVDAIVEGSIQREGNRLRINVQLIEAAADRQLWATNYDRDLADFFVVQDEVARAIAAEVQVRLTPEDQARLVRAKTTNREVIEACLQGAHHWWQWSDEAFPHALHHFRRAVEIDPNYAPAHSGLALVYMAAAYSLWPPREVMPKCREAAQRAIELDPMLADGYVARGFAKMDYDWDWSGAEADFQRALNLSPTSSLALDGYSNLLVARGRFDDAISVLSKALKQDPLSLALNCVLGWTYNMAGLANQAGPHLRKTLELDRKFLLAHLNLGWSDLLTGNLSEAVAEFQTAVQLGPASADAKLALGYAYGVTGRQSEALKMLADLDELLTKRYVTRTAQAWVHLGLGAKDIALCCLERACEERDIRMPWLHVNPLLASLRNEPRFQKLLQEVENGGRGS
jgi:TolB-like protein/cytochrome c-type biogenesis protein CcmH/NrfG